jgi:ATP-dependent Zn protease
MTRPVDRKHTAYHEAGHAVIGLMLGYEVSKVTIRPIYSYLGSAWTSKKRHSSLGSTEVQTASASPDSDDFGHICIELAGPLAEQLINPAPFKELIARGAFGDWQNAQKRARRINRRHAETLIDVLMEETRALVEQHRDAIASVATALLERETLVGDDIKRLTNGSGS